AGEGECRSFARLHGHADAKSTEQAGRAGSGGDDDHSAANARSVGEAYPCYGAALFIDRGGLRRQRLDAERTPLPAERLHQRIAIEPGLAGTAPAARSDVAGRDIRETLGKPGPVKVDDVGAKAGLQRVIAGERRGTGRGREEQVAAFMQGDVRSVTINC